MKTEEQVRIRVNAYKELRDNRDLDLKDYQKERLTIAIRNLNWVLKKSKD